MSRAIARHYQIIDEAVAKHGGARPVEQGEGDSTVSAFARATDAVRAALDIQRTMLGDARPEGTAITVRIGIHTGEAELRGDDNYIGVALNRCARLRSIGHGGQTLLSRPTADLVRDELPAEASLKELGEHSLRDLTRTEHVYQLSHPDLPNDFPGLAAPRSGSGNLPSHLTSFIGREEQIAEVARLLEETRILTLVGSGGCGKTRLAIEVAERVTDRYLDGVLWIDLSSLSDPALVPTSVANALKIREGLMQDPTDTVAAHLENRNLLLVLDNCEHLASACAAFAERVLRACTNVTVMATSREPLGVHGETTWRVPSLTVPSEDGDAEDSESVRLFVERAGRSRPQFRATSDDLAGIATICRRLDGIPLAIELAAARIRTMSPQRIAAGLADRFGLLSVSPRTALPRQRTLEASVDWSHTLLSAPERVLFRRLAIFAGGFTLEAAEHVCAGDGLDEFAVMDLLSQLVDRSLAQMEETGEDARYRLLETVRDYARYKLADSEDAAAMRDRHLAFFVEFVERAEQGLETSAMAEWVDRLERDHDNVRSAIDWSVESQQTDSALRLCAALFVFWLYGNHLPEGRGRVDAMLSLEGGDRGLRARALASAALTATFALDDPSGTRAFSEQAISLARELGDTQTIGRGLASLGFAALYGDPTVGRDLCEEAATAAERSGDVACVCHALSGLVLVETLLSEWDRARDAANRAVEVARASGHPFRQAQTLCWAGFRALWWGELETARRYLDESISIARAINDHFLLSFALGFRGSVEVCGGRNEEGRRDLEESMTIARPGGLFFQVGASDLFSAERCYSEGDLDTGAASAEEAVAIFRAMDFPFGVASGLIFEAFIREAQQDGGAARRLAEEALAIARTNGLPREEGRSLLVIARLQHGEGSLEQAEETLQEALNIFARSHLLLEMIMALEHIAAIACANDSYAEAARLLGATQAVRDGTGYRRPSSRKDEHESLLDALRAGLGDEGFVAAWKDGAALTLDEAVAYVTRARGERKRPSHGWASLTPTELDVVRLVRDGLTSPQIAERMFIAHDTVRTHLKHVFVKLGVSTRAELAAQAERRQI
jgi:predicted ATPase/DNA-binding CsgD family transcriptional regulator